MIEDVELFGVADGLMTVNSMVDSPFVAIHHKWNCGAACCPVRLGLVGMAVSCEFMPLGKPPYDAYPLL